MDLKDMTVQQTQAAYAIAACNELLDAWGCFDGQISNDADAVEVLLIIEDIAITNGVRKDYRLTQLGPYVPCGGER